MIYLGIDVGITGAIAAIDSNGNYVGVEDLDVMHVGKTKWVDADYLLGAIRELRNGRETFAFIEHIHATPKMGCTTGHSLGLTMGSVLAILQVAAVPFDLVTPVTWKKSLGLLAPGATDREKKLASLCKARMLFPTAPLERQKDNGRAEALLIASYGRALRHAVAKEAA